jgi:hypothetical protein
VGKFLALKKKIPKNSFGTATQNTKEQSILASRNPKRLIISNFEENQ